LITRLAASRPNGLQDCWRADAPRALLMTHAARFSLWFGSRVMHVPRRSRRVVGFASGRLSRRASSLVS
jgi:hypothetical protein